MKSTKTTEKISIRGARQNNLKNINLDIEPYTWTVITGPSGSGKSSLAFDTLYAEGQRRYVETFSSYARQFLDRCDQPAVDSIKGVPPAIAINQSNTVRTSRSTVGTMTELADYFKLLFSREGKLFCRKCGEAVTEKTPAEMWEDITKRASLSGDPRLVLTFDVLVPKKISSELAITNLAAQGFSRIHSERKTREGVILSVVADRFRASKAEASRGIEAIETALKTAKGSCAGKFIVHAMADDGTEALWPYATGLTCAQCGITYSKPNSATFSFNSAVGACPTCHGFGRTIGFDIDLVIPNPNLSIEEGCIKPWARGRAYEQCLDDLLRVANLRRVSTSRPFCELQEHQKNWIINGDEDWRKNCSDYWYGIRRFFEYLEGKTYSMPVRVFLSRYRTYQACPDCGGSRVKPDALLWRLGSRAAADAGLGAHKRFLSAANPGIAKRIDSLPGLTLHDLMLLPVSSLVRFFDIYAREVKNEPGKLLISQIRTRLGYLIDVGLEYLTLDRQSRTLSGGEIQRVNLTTALGTNLVDTLFVLDEPSVGLHPRDMDRVDGILRRLRDAGNTLVVVEHDPQVMLAADRIVDMGPRAGEKGGRIVFDGTPAKLREAETLTGLYLSGRLGVSTGLTQRAPNARTAWLEMKGIRLHNLKDIDARFPLGYLTTVTGVSGSGKSSLVADALFSALERYFGRAADAVTFSEMTGQENLANVHIIDQSAITKTSRSTPALFVGAFDPIRLIFASTKESQRRHYSTGHFSFNSALGQCPSCQGSGFERVEMQFMSDVYLRCEACNGKRYRPEILEVTINLDSKKDLSIADVLDMTVSEALEYFKDNREICRTLRPLKEVGLDYIKLGQPIATLSGGEAQRIKLAETLAGTKSMLSVAGHLYILDEPTTGLHFDDIRKLLAALRRLVSAGATVILIEHNLDVIDASDWIIDLGPNGGDKGGEIVATGTPDEIAKGKTWTGLALAAYRKTRTDPKATMTGLFASPQKPQKEVGRSLQSVWRKARRGDLGIFGARENNLKDIDVVIPKKKLSVVTGVSGSGKSTLAFGVVFAEGQRRYLESLNAYARSIVQPGAKPDVDRVIGIAPTVAIEQRTSQGGYKSTVATMTEIQQYLRLIYAKLGVQYCPHCNVPVAPQSAETIFSDLLRKYKGKLVTITAPTVNARKGTYGEVARRAFADGIEFLRVDGKWESTKRFPLLSRYSDHTIETPIATLRINSRAEEELRSAITKALKLGEGVLSVLLGTSALGGEKGTPQTITYSSKRACPLCGRSFPEPDPRLFSYNSRIGWCPTCYGTGESLYTVQYDENGNYVPYNAGNLCPDCKGKRLNIIARAVLFESMSICDLTALSVDAALEKLTNIELHGRSKAIGEAPLKEVISRLRFLKNVGLGYLALDRSAPTLSGGEAQRIRLASQLGNNLQGVCYVLDEPTIGLHARDNERLISSLVALKDKGNTVVVVEHDEEMIRTAEHIIDIGPGAGREGGKLIIEGTLSEVSKTPESVTGQFLSHPMPHTGVPRHPAGLKEQYLTARSITMHNLKDLSVRLPLGKLIALTGVSGSGKSTLACDVLLVGLQSVLCTGKSKKVPSSLYGNASFTGCKNIKRVLEVNQAPIGKTVSSCPATYVDLLTPIRTLFAETNTAKEHGWGISRFSFNVKEGRCPVCSGQGQISVEMNFLPTMQQPCEVCHGKRFNEETLSVLWHGKSIGDVLQMSVDEAAESFKASSAISSKLQMMQAVGLGYLTLGQPSSTLSGGEAQRIKLVSELAKATTSRRTGRKIPTLYILDEPTVGLHMADVKKLIDVLHTLVDAGHTVLVVEHNLDLIAEADYIIDLGPEGGPNGGNIVARGTPIDVAEKKTATGIALKAFLKAHASRTTKKKGK